VTRGGAVLLRPRWITALPGRHRRATGRNAGLRAAGVPEEPREPRTGRLVLLIMTGDARSGDLAGWRRGRAVLVGVDKKIAKMPVACRVRALPGGAANSELRQAGRLSRRDLKRPARAVDFARALGAARTVLARDLATLERSGLRVARPAAVFFAVDPPLADGVTAEEYERLTRVASVTWVVPESSAALLAASFADGDARILTDHDAVTDELAHLLSGQP
jgi:hypothetical protein